MLKGKHRLLILFIILLLVICFILWRANHKIYEIDQQMPDIGYGSTSAEF